MRIEQVRDLMKAIGPIADLYSVDEAADGTSWQLLVDDEFALIVEYDEKNEVFVFTADAAQPDDFNRTKFFELLLQYNRHWPETGIVMALDNMTGMLVQIYRRTAIGLEISALSTIVHCLAEKARQWRGMSDRLRSAAPAVGVIDFNTAIRV
jgi:hypothetical protein